MKKLFCLLPLLSFSAFADWQLQEPQSSVTFVSTKQTHFREVHQIQKFDVEVQNQKDVVIKLDLSSVESGIPIRNERMQKMLFDVADFRFASLKFTLPESLDSITKAKQMQLKANLTIKDKTVPVSLDILITKSHGEVVATLLKPVIIQAAQFGLKEGIDALQKIAGLKSIGYSVPVYATITLAKS